MSESDFCFILILCDANSMKQLREYEARTGQRLKINIHIPEGK